MSKNIAIGCGPIVLVLEGLTQMFVNRDMFIASLLWAIRSLKR